MYGIPDSVKPLSAAEEQVMLAVWACRAPATRRDIDEKLRAKGWAPATVLNFLYRLEEKGWVKSGKDGNHNTYTPAITQRAYNVWSMREHVNRLHFHHLIFSVEHCQISCLGGWIATYIHNSLGLCIHNHAHYIFVHTSARWVDDHHVGTSVLFDESVGEHVLHVAGKEDGVVDAVDLGVEFRVGNRLGHVFDAHHFFHLPRHEVGYCAGSGV